MQTEYIEKITKGIINLPTLPTVAAQLFELSDDEKSQRNALEQIVSSDPVLTARLLKIINARGESITSIHSAIDKLGFEQAKNISQETFMSKFFELKDSKVDSQKMWEHFNAVSIVARTIALEYEPSLAADAATAGLLHDIGKIILLQYKSNEFEQAIALSKSRSCELYLAEREILGKDHGQTGADLAESWRLPRSIGEVMLYHHDLSRAVINRPLVVIVSFADILCRILEVGDGGNYAQPVFTEELAKELSKWRIDLELSALKPLMLLCINELNKRNLTRYE
ncbi:MAG: HDOD domain-containing protein [Fibromonadaceae bacterium]|jgi:putative nucleotidyltransferase with HDIG domain|nr:HDOD domain-containing protein [Fibromonadaceae bacterium]